MVGRRLYILHASICHTLANPKRLEIIDQLRTGEMPVTDLAIALEISQANLSQHLAIMRQKGIVTTRRVGLNVFYRLNNPKIIQACDLMRQVLLEHLEAGAELAREELTEKEPIFGSLT
jgi:DNA-binding transcriptional ArsR family regulator